MLTRRVFIATMSSGAIGALLLPAPAGARARARARGRYRCLEHAAAAFITAAGECFIPATPSSPGATAAGVTAYIDAQLSSPWGQGHVPLRGEQGGGWQMGTARLPRTSKLSPAQYVQTAASALLHHLEHRLGSVCAFDRLPLVTQRGLLESWSTRSVDLHGIPSVEFLEALLLLTVEGYFSQPRFAQTRDRIAWPMPAFPGSHSAVWMQLS